MADNRTKDGLKSLTDQTIRNKTQERSITKTQMSDLLDEYGFNIYSGIASAPRIIFLTTSITYDPKLHRGAFFIAEPTQNIGISLPAGLGNTDSFTVWNKTSQYNISFSGQLGSIYNLQDNSSVDYVQPGGKAFVFKQPSGTDFYTFGTGLAFQGVFQINSPYPRVASPTSTGGSLQVSYTQPYTFWYMGLANNATEPTSAQIKAQTGAIFGAVNLSAQQNQVYTSNFSGASANTAYDIWIWAESGSNGIKTKLDWTSEQAPALGDIAVRSYITKMFGDAGWVHNQVGQTEVTQFTFNFNIPTNGAVLVFRSFRGQAGRTTTSMSISGVQLTKITAVESPTSTPVYIDVFMLLREQAPANNANAAFECVGPLMADESEMINILQLEEVAQSIPIGAQIATWQGSGQTANTLNFTGLPTSGYMLVNYGVSQDDPPNTVFADVPGGQTVLHQGIDQENVTSVASWKKGTAASNSMQVIDLNNSKAGHVAIRLNPVSV